MKAAVLLIYIVMNILYLAIGDGRIWGGMQHINQYFCIVFALFCSVNKKQWSKIERLLAYYAIFLCLALSLYTIPCIWGNPQWVSSHTYWFTVIISVVFIGTIIYGWYKYRNELGEY